MLTNVFCPSADFQRPLFFPAARSVWTIVPQPLCGVWGLSVSNLDTRKLLRLFPWGCVQWGLLAGKLSTKGKWGKKPQKKPICVAEINSGPMLLGHCRGMVWWCWEGIRKSPVPCLLQTGDYLMSKSQVKEISPPGGVWDHPWVLWAGRGVSSPGSCRHNSGFWHLWRRCRTGQWEVGAVWAEPW